MSKNFPLRRLPGKVVQQRTPSPKSRNFGQSYQRSDGYSYTFKQIPTRLTVYRRDASTLRPLTDRRKPAFAVRNYIRVVKPWIIGHGAHAQSSRAMFTNPVMRRDKITFDLSRDGRSRRERSINALQRMLRSRYATLQNPHVRLFSCPLLFPRFSVLHVLTVLSVLSDSSFPP